MLSNDELAAAIKDTWELLHRTAPDMADDLVRRVIYAMDDVPAFLNQRRKREAQARAAIAECFKWREYNDEKMLPDGLKIVYSPTEPYPLRSLYGPLTPPNEKYQRWFIALPEPPKETDKDNQS